MKQNFERCFEIVIGHEGGFTADPRDPGNWTGGKCGVGVCKGTKYGLAANTWGSLDIPNLTLADAHQIYKQHYWDAIGGDSLPSGLDLAAFDLCINSGVGRARQLLAQAGGDYGRLCDLRLAFMRSLPVYATFGRGWEARVATLRGQCAALAAQPIQTPRGQVLLVDGGGNTTPWDGKPTTYGGAALDSDMVARLRAAYPQTGGPWQHGNLKVWVRQNGDMVLEKPH